MTAIRVFIQRNPVLCYFALVFAISYSGFLAVVGPTNIPVTFATLGPGVHVAILAGPTVAGLLFLESDSFSGALPLALLLVRLFSWLPAYRVLMVWVYDRTESLLVAMLMHTSLVATQVLFRPPAASAGSQLISILIWAAMLWAAVAVIAVADRGHLSRPPLPKWAA